MYDNVDKVQQVANEVVRAGVRRDAIDVLRNSGNGSSSSWVGKLTERGVEEREAAIYAEEIGKGSFMVVLEAPDETAENACEIMNRFGARDLEQLLAEVAVSRPERESVPVVEEQVDEAAEAAPIIWRFNHKPLTMPAGRTLRLEVLAPANVHWSVDDWASAHDAPTRDTSLGVHVADLPTNGLAASARVLFTFYWPDAGRWEGADFAVTLT
jgi:hypothetical protein